MSEQCSSVLSEVSEHSTMAESLESNKCSCFRHFLINPSKARRLYFKDLSGVCGWPFVRLSLFQNGNTVICHSLDLLFYHSIHNCLAHAQ